MVQTLLNNVNGDFDGVGVGADGGAKTVIIRADDFGGGTVTLQGSDDNVTFITLTIGGAVATFTANAIRVIDHMGQGSFIRATLTGSTSPSNVRVKIF